MDGQVTLSSGWPAADASVLTLRGEFDASDAPGLVTRVQKTLDEGATKLTLDMRNVTFIDSAMIGALLTCSRRFSARRARLALLMDRTSPVYRLLEITALDRQFAVFDSPSEAAEHLLQNGPQGPDQSLT